jgi:hypothetical protein
MTKRNDKQKIVTCLDKCDFTGARKHGNDSWERLQEQYEWQLEQRLYHAWGDAWQERLNSSLYDRESDYLIQQIREETYTLQAGNKRVCEPYGECAGSCFR